MKTRRILSGDYSFGSGRIDIIDGSSAILQTCKTRLMQIAGEWFLNKNDGVRWGDILGHRIDEGHAFAIIKRTLESIDGVKSVTDISINTSGRSLVIFANIETKDDTLKLSQSINAMEIIHDQAN